MKGPQHDATRLPQGGFDDVQVIQDAMSLPDPTVRAVALQELLRQTQERAAFLTAQRDDALRAMRSEGASYGDIAKLLGVSRSRAQQLCERLAPDSGHWEGRQAGAHVLAPRMPVGAGLGRGPVAGDDESQVAPAADGARWMLPGEVARLFGVNPRTITRWATTGQLTCVVSPSGRRRYRTVDVEALLGREPQVPELRAAGQDPDAERT